MLTQICAEIHNYFCKPTDIHEGSFKIADGGIEPLSFLKAGQFYRIKGSTFNDGVWQYGANELIDEEFTGEVWAMSVPPAIIDLSNDIEDWLKDDGVQAALNSPYTSESYAGYSYTKRSGGTRSDGSEAAYGWQSNFAARLRPYRKLREV